MNTVDLFSSIMPSGRLNIQKSKLFNYTAQNELSVNKSLSTTLTKVMNIPFGILKTKRGVKNLGELYPSVKVNLKHTKLCLSVTLCISSLYRNKSFMMELSFCQKCQVKQITQPHLFGSCPVFSQSWAEVRSATATMIKCETLLCTQLLFTAHKEL